MRLDFHDVLAGIRTRLTHDHHQGFINQRVTLPPLTLPSPSGRGVLRAHNIAHVQAVIFQLMKQVAIARTDDARGHVNGVGATDADDADAPFPYGSGDRTDGIVNEAFHRENHGFPITTFGNDPMNRVPFDYAEARYTPSC